MTQAVVSPHEARSQFGTGSIGVTIVGSDATVLTLAGAADRPLIYAASADLRNLATDRGASVVVDASDLQGSDFTLVGALARAHMTLRTHHGQLYVLVGEGSEVWQQLKRSPYGRVATVVQARPH